MERVLLNLSVQYALRLAAAIGQKANTRGTFFILSKKARKARRPCRILASPK